MKPKSVSHMFQLNRSDELCLNVQSISTLSTQKLFNPFLPRCSYICSEICLSCLIFGSKGLSLWFLVMAVPIIAHNKQSIFVLVLEPKSYNKVGNQTNSVPHYQWIVTLSDAWTVKLNPHFTYIKVSTQISWNTANPLPLFILSAKVHWFPKMEGQIST